MSDVTTMKSRIITKNVGVAGVAQYPKVLGVFESSAEDSQNAASSTIPSATQATVSQSL